MMCFGCKEAENNVSKFIKADNSGYISIEVENNISQVITLKKEAERLITKIHSPVSMLKQVA